MPASTRSVKASCDPEENLTMMMMMMTVVGFYVDVDDRAVIDPSYLHILLSPQNGTRRPGIWPRIFHPPGLYKGGVGRN